MSDPYSTLPSTDVAVGDDPYGALPTPQAPAAPVVPVDPYMAVPHDPRYGGYPNADDSTLGRHGIEAVKSFTEQTKNQIAGSLIGSAATSKGPAVVGGFGIMSPQEEFLAQEEMSRNVGPLDPTKNPLMIAGKAVQNFGKAALAPAPGWEGSWTRDIAGGFGSLFGNIGMSLLSPGAAALSMVTAGSGEAYDTAIQKGATAEQAARAAQLGTVPGATDMVDMMLGSLGTTGKVAGFIKRVGTRAIKGAIAEGGQEGFQQFLQNAISKGVYKPDQDLMEDVPRSMIIGGIVGSVATPLLHKREDHGTSPANAPTEAEIARYFTGNTPDPTIQVPATSVPPAAATPVSPVAGVEPVPAPLEPTEIFPPSSPTAPNVTRLAIPVEPEPRTKNEIPAEVVDFLAKRSQKLGLPSEDALAQGTESDLTPQMEEISSTPGANVGRLARLLGPKLYGDPTDMDKVSVKEIVQNSFDAIKTELEKGSIKEGQLHINMDPTSRTIRVYDNGSGMTPEVLAKQFLEIAGTHKESARASGGLGIAKMLFLFANKGLKVSTMRNGKIARLVTTGDELFNAMDNKSKAPKIRIDNPTAQDHSIFKDGHGTVIEVTVPESFQNSEGQQQKINFDPDAYGHKVLTRSPLFDNIEVHFNGKPLDGFPAAIGKHFPTDQYQPLFNAKFGWGTAHFYVSKTEQEHMKYGQNMHVLSNGLWQFSGALKKDPAAPYGENVERNFYVDVSPTVKAEDAGYPFDLNRQKFSSTAKEDLGKIFNYLSVLYQHQALASGATNFGQIHYLHDDNGNLVKSRTISIEPKALPTETPLNMIRAGDAVSIVDGKIVVNGREIPEIKPEDVKKYTPDASELKVDQKEIDPNRVMVHDNVIVRISDVEAKSIIELGEEKFGPRFDQFLLAIGNEFKLLRDVVADSLGYPDLKKEAIGISFDTKYRGVSIRLPFSGSFINPALPEYNDTLRAAVGMAGTMVHELMHHQVRGHDADAFAEMQRIIIHLDVHPTFDFFALKQRMVNYVAQNKDIFDYINGVFSGAFPIEPRGKRFEDASSVEARNAGPSGPMAQIGGPAERRSSIPSSVGTSTANTPSGGGRGRSYFRATENGPINLLDETAANTRAVQQASGDPDVVGAPAQAENLLLKDGVKALFQATSPKKKGPGGGPPIVPPAVAAMAAHGDELSRYYKFAMGLDRLVDRFPNFAPLLRYAERSREMKLDSARIQDAALRIAKEWRSLGDRAEPLAALIDDVANMRYLSDSEKKNGVERHPTKQEFTDLVRRHKVSSAALNVFFKQKNFFHVFLDLVRKNAIEDAKRTITDPVKLANKVDAINIEVKLLADRPYFPMLNFGTHYVAVVDSAGEYVFFKTYERKGLKSAQQVQQEARKKLENGLPADHTVIDGILPESTQPFVGLPRMLLEGITSSMSLTPAQQTALKQMRFGSTASRYKYLFEHKSYVPGYSHDFLRAFSRYAFHGARFYARTKYIPSMQKEINNVRLVGGNQAGSIANYMEDHLYNTVLDAKGDYGKLKGGIFLFTFGYSVAGATINLSQIPFFTHNFLSTRFGGVCGG
jgi:hypothetical protein